jgi:tetratricopeptide (TPR) repeat protein
MRARVFGVMLVVAVAAQAQPAAELRARELYATGKAAYDRGEYQAAYDAFWQSYQLSHAPELLYNVASALQGLHRPRDAAEALRSFVRLRPTDPDRMQIEDRIHALDEEQRLFDLAARKNTVEPSPAPLILAPPAREPPRRRRVALTVGLSVGAAVVVGLAVGLGVGLSSGEAAHTASAIPPIPATR